MPKTFVYGHEDHGGTILRVLDTNGDGSGNKNMVGDYSASDVDFFIQPAPGEVFVLFRVLIHIETPMKMDTLGYGSGLALTSGIRMVVTDKDDVELLDMFDGFVVDTNADWGAVAHDVNLLDFGNGGQSLNVRWTLPSGSVPMVLQKQQKFKVIAADDFNGPNEQFFYVHGVRATITSGEVTP